MRAILLSAFILTAIGCNKGPDDPSWYIGTWVAPDQMHQRGQKIKFELQKKSQAKVWVDGKLKTISTWSVEAGGKVHVVIPFIPQKETWVFEEKKPGVFRHIAIKIKETTTPLQAPRMILEKIDPKK
jgi:hypothetical protein